MLDNRYDYIMVLYGITNYDQCITDKLSYNGAYNIIVDYTLE